MRDYENSTQPRIKQKNKKTKKRSETNSTQTQLTIQNH